jgi:hypothetical protein
MRISVEQQRQNVETLHADWVRIGELCGRGSSQERAMFATYAKAARQLAVSEVQELVRPILVFAQRLLSRMKGANNDAKT